MQYSCPEASGRKHRFLFGRKKTPAQTLFERNFFRDSCIGHLVDSLSRRERLRSKYMSLRLTLTINLLYLSSSSHLDSFVLIETNNLFSCALFKWSFGTTRQIHKDTRVPVSIGCVYDGADSFVSCFFSLVMYTLI